MTTKAVAFVLMAGVALIGARAEVAGAAEAQLLQVSITASSPLEGVRWYVQHMKCEPIADRRDTARCGDVELVFIARPTRGSTQGETNDSNPAVKAATREIFVTDCDNF